MFLISNVRRAAASSLMLVLLAAGCSSKTKSASESEATTAVVAETTAAPALTEPAATTPPATTPPATADATPASATAGSAPDPIPLLSGGRQRAWYITQRVTNGGAPDLPVCAKDDELIFDAKGGFISVIGGTQCNPSETEVPNGTYKLSPDNQVITFTTPAFSYPGKIIKLTDGEMVLEFDLGPGFVIQDTFAKR